MEHNPTMPIPRLETARLTLRGLTAADRHPFAAMNQDPEVMAFMSRRLDRSASSLFMERIREHWDEQGFGLWALERRSDRAFLGFAGLSVPAFEAPFMPAVEVGWRLARNAWGHGYATEAGSAALNFGFTGLRLREVVSFTAVGNERSRRVMERIGMNHDAGDDFDYPFVAPGHAVHRQVLYRISLVTWQQQHDHSDRPSAVEPA